MPDLDKYLINNCIEIVPHTDWFLKDGSFNSEGVIVEWDRKLLWALENDFTGMRVNANAFWPDRVLWKTFIDYERDFNEQVKNKRIIALSTYPLSLCNASDLLDVAKVYDIAVTMRHGKWEIMESPVLTQSKAQFKKTNEELESRIIERTHELKESNDELLTEIKNHIATENELMVSQANLYSIFKNTGTIFVLLDTDLNILFFNGVAAKMSVANFDTPYSIGAGILDIIPSERREKLKTDCEMALNGKPVTYDSSFVKGEGTLTWYSVCIFPVINDDLNIIGVCISSEDITRRKLAEIEKEKMTNDLIQRNNDLEQFSYMVSHNLRAPVANIMGFSKMLEDNVHDTANRRVFAGQINLSAHLLDEVIRDLNIILQVKTENLARDKDVSFRSVIDNIRKTLKADLLSVKAVIRTNFKNAETIDCSRAYLYSIFLNLITNSIKYHQPDIAPVINISTQAENGKIILVFSDNGIGIDLERNSDKVFGLYKRFHAEIEGKGLGLYMVKTQVSIMGGTISIQSEVNKGTKFTIILNQ